jgi:hypothetical protein
MSFHQLLKHYHNGDVEKFRALLSNSSNGQHSSKGFGGGQGNAHSMGSLVGSPSGFGSSPKMATKHRKSRVSLEILVVAKAKMPVSPAQR